MAEAMQHGVLAGREAYLAGRMPRKPLRHRQLAARRRFPLNAAALHSLRSEPFPLGIITPLLAQC